MIREPTIDECLRAYPLILERLKRLEDQNDELINLFKGAKNGLTQPQYDVNELRKLGMGRNRAYEILKAAGRWRSGRMRITAAELTTYLETL